MSYVLDALKKAERERHHQPDLGMDNLEQDEWVKPIESETGGKPKISLWILGVSICILALAVTVNLRLNLEESEQSIDLPMVEQLVQQNSLQSLEIGIDESQDIETLDISEDEPDQDFNLEERLQEFRFEGSLYIEGNPQSSRVFIDGQAYFVGQTLKNDVYIKDIRLDSVVISNGYEEVIRTLR